MTLPLVGPLLDNTFFILILIQSNVKSNKTTHNNCYLLILQLSLIFSLYEICHSLNICHVFTPTPSSNHPSRGTICVFYSYRATTGPFSERLYIAKLIHISKLNDYGICISKLFYPMTDKNK